MYKYKIVQVKGHPRAGNHYLSALIDINFFTGGDYTKNVINPEGGFKFPHRYGGQDLRSNEVLLVYIWRNFDDTANSLFKLRARFGLDEDDFESFLERKLCDMWNPEMTVNVKIDRLHRVEVNHEVDALLKDEDKTVLDYWQSHIKSWINLCFSNVLVVKYEKLKQNHNAILRQIGVKLGNNRERFVDINKRVGWMLFDEGVC